MKQVVFLVFAFLMMFGCTESGDKVAKSPTRTADCYSQGTCSPSGFAYDYRTSYPYRGTPGQPAYSTTSGFNGCSFNQYPVFYPNTGYICVTHSAFTTGVSYSILNYQPRSLEFQRANGIPMPYYYNYGNGFVFQGCLYGTSTCGCSTISGLPYNYGVCLN